MDVAELIERAGQKTASLTEGLHVLALQDTAELNYPAHADRTNGLGRVGNDTDKGLFLHPMLTINADTEACLGLSGLKLWACNQDGERAYWTLPIEEKESCRWLEVVEQARKTLSKAAMITIIADRESDLYEEWAHIPDAKSQVLTRVCLRILKKQGFKFESSQLEQAQSLMKLVVLSVQVAVTSLQLVSNREAQTE